VSPRQRAEVMRDEMVMHDRITALLREGPMTIPALAEALGYPSPEVVCWVMAMRRYGMLEEEGRADDDGYFSYRLTEKAAGEAETG
jgi:DNA-binding IclR family transcriptional regulator